MEGGLIAAIWPLRLNECKNKSFKYKEVSPGCTRLSERDSSTIIHAELYLLRNTPFIAKIILASKQIYFVLLIYSLKMWLNAMQTILAKCIDWWSANFGWRASYRERENISRP